MSYHKIISSNLFIYSGSYAFVLSSNLLFTNRLYYRLRLGPQFTFKRHMVSGSWSGSTEKPVKTKVSITKASDCYQLGRTMLIKFEVLKRECKYSQF